MATIIECISGGQVDLSLGDPFKHFQIIIDGFFNIIPELIKIPNIPKLSPTKLPNFMFDILTAKFDKSTFPSFGLEIAGIKLGFKGKDYDLKLFDIGAFDFANPKLGTGLLGFIGGLLSLAFKIPTIFIDFDKKKPKTPNIEVDIKGLIDGLGIPEKSLPPGFIPKFTNCLTESLTGLLKP